MISHVEFVFGIAGLFVFLTAALLLHKMYSYFCPFVCKHQGFLVDLSRVFVFLPVCF